MKVSGSILAARANDYFDYAKKLKFINADYLHVDIFQESSVFTIEDLLRFDNSDLPLDVHLIFEDITKQNIEILNSAKVQILNIQYENIKNKAQIRMAARLFNGKFGIAITSKTPIDIIEDYFDCISQVLFMCSEPGVSGAKFDDKNFERIRAVRMKYPSLELQADGGINDSIGEEMGNAGVSMIVSGSYLYRNYEEIGNNVYRLKYLNEYGIGVTKNMVQLNALPLISKNAGFIEIIDTMNRYRMGLVMVVESNNLLGIISDGDIRRNLLVKGKEIFDSKAEAIMNKEPYVVERDKTMEDIFKALSQIHKGIDVIPIMEDDRIIGAVDLHMGI